MSFKAGIPLLSTLDDEDDESDGDFSVEIESGSTRRKWGRKHLLFCIALCLAVSLLLAVIVAITVPVVLLQVGQKGGATMPQPSAPTPSLSSPSTPSPSSPSTPSPSSPSTPSPSTPSPSSPSTPSPSASSQMSHPSEPTSSPSTPSPSPSTSSQMPPITPTPSPTPPPSQCSNLSDCKPVLDERSYKLIVLSNSLRVLLISDPKSNVSAASMEVDAGSFSDPLEAEGLAHFCEHMLFLGTEKYPDEHVYSNYLTTHGGYDNAFTSTQDTNYYFNIDSAYLEHALDLFAQFFIAPLFRNTSVEDEVHAVNAEHEKNLQSDGWRLWQLLKHVSNPAHPFHKFSTGSLSTLNNSRVDLLQLLMDYYNTNYSASTMQLTVYGRDSIDTLANWTETYFTNIANRSVSPQTFSSTAFPPNFSGKLVLYYTVADTNTLSLYWQTQPLESRYRNDVTEFLSRYLAYEGPGSILCYLKRRTWASSLTAGSEVDADSFSLLVVSIEVTEEGLPHVSEIVHSVFQFIRLLVSQSDSALESLWRDHVAVSQIIYDYSEPSDPSDYAQNLAQTMRLVADPPDLLGNPDRLVLNSTLIQQVLASLSPENSVVFIGTRHVDFADNITLNFPHEDPPQQDSDVALPWPKLNQLEPYYSTPFSKLSLPQNVMLYWNDDDSDVPDLQLPGENSYIPDDFEILPPPADHSSSPVLVDLASNKNLRSGVTLWWLQDTTFESPHVNMYCTMEASQANSSSPRWSELTTLYTLLATEVLTPILYPASELTYFNSLTATPTGLHLSVSGFSDSDVMQAYLQTILTQMKNFTSLQSAFDIVKEDHQLYLENYKYTTLPYRYIYRYLQQVIMARPYWKHEQQLNQTGDISVGDVMAHAEQLFSNATFLCFAHGNIDKQQAVSYTEMVVSTLSPAPRPDLAPQGGHQRKRVALSAPGNYSVSLATLNPSDQNSAVNVIYQIGPTCNVTMDDASTCSPDSIRTATLLGLIYHIIGDFCFYQLRTVKQLGYVAFCFQGNYGGIGSFQVVVQSQEYNASYVLREIDQFLEDFGNSTIANMSTTDLEMKKKLYANSLKQKSKTLSEESDRLWEEIATGTQQFDYNSQLLNTLSSITAQDVEQFYTSHITNSSQYRKLVLSVYGKDKEVDFSSDFSYCMDYDKIDQTAEQYPTPNTQCSMS